MKKLYIRLEFKPQDCWIGVYWKTSKLGTFPNSFGTTIDFMSLDIWICLLPMLPLHIIHTWEDGLRPIRREQALNEIARLSQEAGLYD